MQGQRIGYVRVSSLDENPDRQLEQIPVDRTFTDKASGKDVARPQCERPSAPLTIPGSHLSAADAAPPPRSTGIPASIQSCLPAS